MSWQDLATIVGVLAAVPTLLGMFVTVYVYLGGRSRTERMTLVGAAFREVVSSLASDKPTDRLAGAVLLRRFFDPLTEYGLADTPYATEALNVIAAILRKEETEVFQKLLADGLAFAESLAGADLQEANLEKAFLGARDGKRIRLDKADLYKANLGSASLKGASAVGTIFCEANLAGTVFVNADLRGANFARADLKDARFEGANLAGASFQGATNIPAAIAARLDAQGKHP